MKGTATMTKGTTTVMAMAVAAGVLLTGCSSAASGNNDQWSEAPNPENFATQAETITTYALPDEWANYGALLNDFCEQNDLDCSHVDSDMSSGEAIQRYDAEKGNPIGYFSDIGGLWGPWPSRSALPPHAPVSSTFKAHDRQPRTASRLLGIARRKAASAPRIDAPGVGHGRPPQTRPRRCSVRRRPRRGRLLSARRAG